MLSGRFHLVDFAPGSLTIQADEIIRLLGYEGQEIDDYLREMIDDIIAESHTHFNPRGGYLCLDIESFSVEKDTLIIGGTKFTPGKIIINQLMKAEKVMLFVATLGKEIEVLYDEYFNSGSSLEGYIMNLAASEAADALAEQIHQLTWEAARKEGFKVTNRFSPGYCNWDVEEQFKLFSKFPKGNCGVKLTSSALMQPIKSVSGMIGIGEKVEYKPYTCARCTDEKCLYRNQ